jgi:thiol:disulfide interchange protein
MKKLIIIALTGWLAVQANAADWLTDVPKALATAKAGKKLVFLDFTGSDWCPPCKALEKNVLSSPEFEAFAKKNLVLVQVDFPTAKPQTAELKSANKKLAEKYNIKGYPTVIVLDADGKILSQDIGYGGESTKEFMAKYEKLAAKLTPQS